MTHFEPAFEISEATAKVKSFMKENKQIFWDVYGPLMPYFLGCVLIDIFGSPFIGEWFSLFTDIFLGYLTFSLVITWHRVVIHGADNYVPVNLLLPEKSELAFMGMGLLLAVIAVIGFTFMGALGSIAGPLGGLLFVLISVFLALFIFSRLSFYFPAKATDSPLTLGQAYKLSEGYIWKIFSVGVLSQLRMILILILYYIVLAIILFFVARGLSPAFSLTENIDEKFINIVVAGMLISLGKILILPISIYMQPLMIVYGVTVLSNYYQHAMQHKTEFYKQS